MEEKKWQTIQTHFGLVSFWGFFSSHSEWINDSSQNYKQTSSYKSCRYCNTKIWADTKNIIYGVYWEQAKLHTGTT